MTGNLVEIVSIKSSGMTNVAMTRVKQVFEPQTVHAAMYQERFETYLSLTEAMRSFWSKMHDAK